MNMSRTILVNEAIRFGVPEGDIILDAALSQGVVLPHQCRGASCGTVSYTHLTLPTILLV